jgi:hypothetical protein
MLENRELRKIFGSKKGELRGIEKTTYRGNFMI